MRCREVRRRLSALQDDEVTPSERVQLDEHLADCAGCQRELDRLTLPDPSLEVPPEIGRLLWEKVRATPVLARSRLAVPPRVESARWRSWLGSEVGVSRGALVVYAALMLAAIAWGATAWMPSSSGPAPSVVLVGDEAASTAHDTVPASHTGLPAREIQPSEWQNASFPNAGP